MTTLQGIREHREHILQQESLKYLIWSGGGVRGLCYFSAYSLLERECARLHHYDLFENLKGIAGTSIGAFFAMMLSINCRGQILKQDLLDAENNFISCLNALKDMSTCFSLVRPDFLSSRVRDRLQRFAGDADITFKALYEKSKKVLTIAVTNVNKEQLELHNHETRPDLPVWKSVTASMSMPILFAPIQIEGEYYVDGGVLDHLPLNAFPLDQTLAFQLVRPRLPAITSFGSYIWRVLTLPQEVLEKQKLEAFQNEILRDRLVYINTGESSTFDPSPTAAQKEDFLVEGAKAMHAFLYPDIVFSDYLSVTLQAFCTLADQKFKKAS